MYINIIYYTLCVKLILIATPITYALNTNVYGNVYGIVAAKLESIAIFDLSLFF
jgi:hypothetical protein